MDWLFYKAHTHLNYTEEEFLNSSFRDIYKQWEIHCKFLGWELKTNKNTESNDSNKYKKVNIEDLSFL